MRLALLLLATTIAAPAHAQDVEAVAAQPSAPSDAPVETVEPPVEAPPAPERTPRVAVVVAGDPDPETVTAAEAVEIALAEETRVTLPSDAALRGALRGEGETGDGLDEVRAERRRLGLGEARDVSVLAVLGERAGADLVLVVRRHHGALEATGYDVQRRSFYDGEVDVDALDGDALRQFTFRRATRAARPLESGERAPTPEVEEAATAPTEPAHEPDWFEQNWPFFAAGALLVGAVVLVVFATLDNADTPPVLRFEAGGGS